MSKTTLRRDSHVALYMQVAERLAADIAAGKHKPQSRLPSEQALVDRFRVSRVTIRQALAHLVRRGLVVSKQGKGSFVAGPVIRHEIQGLRGFYDAIVSQGVSPETRLLAFAPATPPPRIAEMLGAGQEPLMFLKRLYSLQGRPIGLAQTYLPADASRVTWEQASRFPSYAILETLLGMRIDRADVSIRAQQAGREIGPTLGLAPRMPLLVMERTSYCAAGRPLEHTLFYVQPESYEVALSVRGPLRISTAIKEAVAAV